MAKLPGGDRQPTKLQKRPPKKPKIVKRVEQIAKAINSLNPFD